MTLHDNTQFHPSEVAVQTRLGVADMVAQYGAGFIRSAMPQQHREFFCGLPFVILGVVDQYGYPWAIPLFGREGFISSPKDTQLEFAAIPRLKDALALDFKPGQKIGMLGIQLSNRRRNRMNGVIGNIAHDGFSIDVEQSFGNCPQYIQTRELAWRSADVDTRIIKEVKVSNHFDDKSKALIERSDTFFIASRTKAFNQDKRTGIDVSHRGGKPGFVKVKENVLYFPDFSGNRFFNTLGNIESDGRVGLFFPNFMTGETLLVSGRANILWNDPATEQIDGAERIIEVVAEKVTFLSDFIPMEGDLVEPSPALKGTGTWQSAVQKESKSDYEEFRLVGKQKESSTITSFLFKPTREGKTKGYIPGQFISLKLNLPGEKQPLIRSYTLSRAPVDGSYRISVKREEHGVASVGLHDQVCVGDTVGIAQPAGTFVLQQNVHGIVLISGGVGITPMMAILEGIVKDFERSGIVRPVWFVHGTQNSETQAFAKELYELSARYDWLHVHTAFSQPLEYDALNQTHHSNGRLTIELLTQVLSNNSDTYDFYLCGSEGFMQSLYSGLIEIGVAKSHIFYEFFSAGVIEASSYSSPAPADSAVVTFKRSNISTEWVASNGSLLEFAEMQGLQLPYGCRTGSCGTCACKLKSGEVTYDRKLGSEPKKGDVLICCAKPAKGTSDIIIEA